MTNSIDDLLAGGHTEAAFNKHTPFGTTVGGTVVSSSPQQTRDYNTGEPEFWDDNRPKMQIKVVVDTGRPDPAIQDDDGHRAFYIKAWGEPLKQLREALRKAGAKTIEEGAYFAGTLTGSRPNAKNPRLNDEKLYSFEYRSPASNAVAGLLGGETVDQGTGEVHAAPAYTPAQFTPVEAPVAPAPVAAPAAADPWQGQPVPAAPAPVQAPPAAAPAAAAAPNVMDQAATLLRAGMTDDVVVATLGIDPAVLAVVKGQL